LELSLPYRPFQHFLAVMREAGIDMPDAQAISAYDATTLLLHALEEVGDDPESNPEGIRDALLRVRRFPLATGSTTITPWGGTIKPLQLRMIELIDGWPAANHAGTFDESRID